MLSKLEYESVDLKISRGSETYNFDISSAVVKTPDILLSASSGAVLFNPDAPFSDYGLDIPVNICVFDTPARRVFTSAGFAKEKSEKVENAYDALKRRSGARKLHNKIPVQKEGKLKIPKK